MTRTKAHVRHPILRLDVIQSDGVMSSEHRVYCRYQERSVGLGECCACAHCDEIVTEPRPAVACTVMLEDSQLEPDPMGVRTAVGTILENGTSVVEPSISVRDAMMKLRAEDRRSIPIVDDNHVMVGVVHEATFVVASATTASSPARLSVQSDKAITHLMSGVVAVHESTAIRRALELLAAAHLREIAVVNDAGIPIGIFRDIDGLRWLTVARVRSESDDAAKAEATTDAPPSSSSVR